MSEVLFIDKYGKLRGPRSNRGERRESLVNRILHIVVAVLLLFLAGELVFHLLLVPRLTVRNITVRSDLEFSREEVLAVAGVDKNVYYFNLDTAEIRRSLESLPAVREAFVQKVFPDGLLITLHGRIPLSVLFFTTPQGDSVPLVIDEQGVVFQIGSAVTSWDLPVITGVKFTRLRAGMRLPPALGPFLRDLRSLQAREPELFSLVSEVRPISGRSGIEEILLYPVQHPVRLRLPTSLEPALLRNALLILDLLAAQGLTDRVREIDLRSRDAVYRVEED